MCSKKTCSTCLFKLFFLKPFALISGAILYLTSTPFLRLLDSFAIVLLTAIGVT